MQVALADGLPWRPPTVYCGTRPVKLTDHWIVYYRRRCTSAPAEVQVLVMH